MNYAYTIRAVRGDDTVRLPCATAWIALERCRLFAVLGWSVAAFDLKGAAVPITTLEGTAEAEVDTALQRIRKPTDRPERSA
ncbi:hypothetical protein [Methylobacterium sp. 190mf]|uniref:hypothetical protein n=1 Tax=Methylobacterium sp. 190mf TaxID=1761798 RepID=UPI0011B00D57|nr:hypothetical protein [Methylobacterium sp. 190mf]